MKKEILIALDGVSLGYGGMAFLQGLNLKINAQEFLGIVGPNGAGKTTLLRTILRILQPVTGSVTYTGGWTLSTAYVPQRDRLDLIFPLSVRQIVLMGSFARLGALRRPRFEERALAAKQIDYLGLAEVAHKPYRDLSGGQKQRALIARALVAGPQVLILDEPTSGMDLAGEKAIMDLLRRLHREDGLTVIIASHNLNVLASYAEWIILIDKDQGIFRSGPREEILTSHTLSRIYQIPVRVDQWNSHYAVVAE